MRRALAYCAAVVPAAVVVGYTPVSNTPMDGEAGTAMDGESGTTPGIPVPKFKLTVTLRSLNGCRGADPEADFGCEAMEVHVFIAEIKTGTKISFEAGSLEPFVFSEWANNISPCGGTSCTVTLGTDGSLRAMWKVP